MDEYISKSEVIDALYDWSNHTITDAETWHLRQVIGDIKSMPSALGVCNNCHLEKICSVRIALGKYGFCNMWRQREEGGKGEQDG